MLLEDPVAVKTPCCPDSLTKILLDLFSDKDTAGIFYTSDLMVLIDIISRQLHDLCPGEKVRINSRLNCLICMYTVEPLLLGHGLYNQDTLWSPISTVAFVMSEMMTLLQSWRHFDLSQWCPQ